MAARLPAPHRRRQLLAVALEVFGESGYHAASMDAVAEAAGVTKPVLYQHFASKRDLYLQVLGDVGEQLMEAVVSATAHMADPHGQVEAGFAAYFGFVGEHAKGFRLLFGGRLERDPAFAAVGERVEAAMTDTIASLIDVDLGPEIRRMLARGVVGMAESTSRYWVAQDQHLDPDELASRMAGLAWAGLRGIR
jgi:AcrR family transcriptional regulator